MRPNKIFRYNINEFLKILSANSVKDRHNQKNGELTDKHGMICWHAKNAQLKRDQACLKNTKNIPCQKKAFSHEN